MLNEPKKAALGTIAEYLPTGTASGAIASFDDGADGVPVKALTVNIELVQEGSGNPSPDNVRPITPRTDLNINCSGADTSDFKTLTVALGRTIYGGSLTINEDGTGTLKYYISITNPAYTLGSEGGNRRIRFIFSNTNLRDTLICNCLLGNISGYLVNTLHVASNGVCYAYVASSMTNEEIAAMMSNFICVDTDKSRSVSLTVPQVNTIRTLLGENNLWTGAGNVTVKYRRDIGLALAKLEALILENGG